MPGALEQLGLTAEEFTAPPAAPAVQPEVPKPAGTSGSALDQLGLSAEDFATPEAPSIPTPMEGVLGKFEESKQFIRDNPKTILSLAAGPVAPVLGGASAIGRIAASGLGLGGANVIGQQVSGEEFDPAEAAISFAAGAGGQAAGEGLQMLPAAIKSLIRGPATAKSVQESIDDLAGAGTTPTLAQATDDLTGAGGNPILEGLEALAAKAPGGAGRIRKSAEAATNAVRGFIDDAAAKTAGQSAGRLDATTAGLSIKSGVSKFTKRFKDDADVLFGKVRKAMPGSQAMAVNNTMKTLDDLSATIQGAEESSDLLVQPFIRNFSAKLKADAVNGQMPTEAMFKLRSLIGRKLATPELVSDIPKAEMKQVYKALSQDLEQAAKQAGPKAEAAFQKANAFYRLGIKDIDDVLEPLVKNKVPAKVFRALETESKQGATQIKTLRKSMTHGEWKVVAATAAKKLGMANPSQQGAAGDKFSFGTYLTRWNQMDNAAKNALFGGVGSLKSDLDAIARASERIRNTSQAYFNPSGSAAAGGLIASGAAAATGVLTGQAYVVPAIAAGMMSANGLARAMTSPKIVHWLAQSTKIKPNGLPNHITRLVAIAKTQDDDEREATLELLDALGRVIPATPEAEGQPPSGVPLAPADDVRTTP